MGYEELSFEFCNPDKCSKSLRNTKSQQDAQPSGLRFSGHLFSVLERISHEVKLEAERTRTK